MTTDERHDPEALDRRLREAFAPPADVDALARRSLEHAAVATAHPNTARRDGAPASPSAPRVLAEAVGASDTAFPSCTSESQLARTFGERYGQELYVRIDPTRPVAGPFDCESWPTATLLTAGGAQPIDPQPGPFAADPRPAQRVGLLVDALETDPRLVSDPQAGVYAHRREIERLVIYELSREAEPTCLDLFFTPED